MILQKRITIYVRVLAVVISKESSAAM